MQILEFSSENKKTNLSKISLKVVAFCIILPLYPENGSCATVTLVM